MFQVFSREPSERGEGGNYEVVVRIPRADALGRPLKKEQPYIVAHPRFTAQAKAEDSPEAIELEEQEQETQEKPCAPDSSGAAAQVYVSFDPNDADSTQLAQIITSTVLDPYDIRYRCFGPTEGVFLHQDFQKHVQDSEFFLVIMSAGYFESLESRQGRPYKEAVAATQKLPAENVVVVQRAELPSPWAAASGSLSPPQLRQLFVVKPLKFHDNLGHLAALEEHILTTLRVVPSAKAVQTPLAASLQSWGLGRHSYALAAHAGLNFPEELATLSESELLRLGVLAPCQRQISNQLQAMPPGARPHIPESKRNAKALVDLMWGAARRNPQLRDAVAEELRRISSTQNGLDDIRTFAGLETLVKLVAEGSINEKIAAVWALRNFAVLDVYRSKIVASGVLPTLVTLLSAQEVECLHATADLLHLLSTDHPKNVVRIGQAGAVKRLVALLNVSHLPLKRATLGALANLCAAEVSRVRIGKYGGVHRIVAALRNEGANDARCRDLALSALSQLVQVDANRLKTWRCGGVDVLRAIAEGGPMLPQMIAVNTLKALMAGPMIQPGEEFRTKNGRTLSAGEMRSAIRRLSQIPGLQRGSAASGAEKGTPRPALVQSAAANRRELESRMSRPRQSTQLSRHDFDSSLRPQTTPEALRPCGASGASSSWGKLEHSYSGLMINEAWTDLKDREPALRPWESAILRSYPAEDVKSEIAGAYRPYTVKHHIPVTTRMYVLDGPVLSTHLRAFRNDPEFETFVRWKQLPLPDYHPGMFGHSSATGGAANKQKPKRPATAGPSYSRGEPKRNRPRPASQGSYTPRSMPEPGSPPPPLMTQLSHAKSGILKTALSPGLPPGRAKSIVFAEGTAEQSDSEDSPPATARTAEDTTEGQAAQKGGLLGKLGPKSRWKVLTTVLQVAKPQKVYRSVLGRSMTHDDMQQSVERLSSRQPSIRRRPFPPEVPAC